MVVKRARLRKEATSNELLFSRALLALPHANVAKLIAHYQQTDCAYLVFKWYDCDLWRFRIDANGPRDDCLHILSLSIRLPTDVTDFDCLSIA